MTKETSKTVARLAARLLTHGYCRYTDSDCWHFHPQCHHIAPPRKKWLVMRATKPSSGEFCNECLAKARADKRTQAKRKRGK